MNFRQWLEMAMKNPETLDRTEYITVDKSDPQSVKITLYKDQEMSEYISRCRVEKCRPELPYWTCHQSATPEYIGKGYGPLLFDLAIEYATMNGHGLIPATGIGCGSDSPYANRIWQKYYTSRPDVVKKPAPLENYDIDDPKHPYHLPSDHPNYKDDKYNLELDRKYDLERRKERPWLYTVYTKPPTFWNQLLASGTLHLAGNKDHPLAQQIKQTDDLRYHNYMNKYHPKQSA